MTVTPDPQDPQPVSPAMCPHCGEDVRLIDGHLTATHDYPKPFRVICPGSGQIPRCAESDNRPAVCESVSPPGWTGKTFSVAEERAMAGGDAG